MKHAKIFTLIISAVIMAGCAGTNAIGLSSNAASENSVSDTQIISSTLNAEEKSIEEYDEKIFERASYSDLSEAEQIYRSIYQWAYFEHYLLFELQNHVDYTDEICIERLNVPLTGLSEEKIGKSSSASFCRIKDGEMSNGIDIAEMIDSFASGRYTAQVLSGYFDCNFIVSNGNIYVFESAFGNSGIGWTITSDLTLNDITVINEYTIQLDFSYKADYDGTVETEQFTLTMANSDYGWKFDSFTGGRMCLINWFFSGNDDELDLLEQIEDCLSENPIS